MPPSAGACHTTDAALKPDCGRASGWSSIMIAIARRFATSGGTRRPVSGAWTGTGVGTGVSVGVGATVGDGVGAGEALGEPSATPVPLGAAEETAPTTGGPPFGPA